MGVSLGHESSLWMVCNTMTYTWFDELKLERAYNGR